MEWIALATVILRLLAPVLEAWLANLLKRAAENLDNGKGYGTPADYEHSGVGSAENRLWMEAQWILDSDLASLSWWQRLWGVAACRRRYFAAVRATTERRAGDFYAAALTGDAEVHPLTSDEIKAIRREA